jgi:RNA polymerase sigma-70 factor (ECF subfamily)
VTLNHKDQSADSNPKHNNILHIYKRYKSSLKHFIAGYLVNNQDVEDVCQETFLRTYKSSLENGIKKPKSFMFRVAKNLIVSDFRKASTRLNEYVDDIDIITPSVEADKLEDDLLAQEKLGLMCEAIAGLPNKCRQAVIMRKVYGLSTKDIAIRMNISTVTVSNYITRGMCTYNEVITNYNAENELKNQDDNNHSNPQKTKTGSSL